LLTSQGDLLGSSYLNEAFKDHLMKRLKDETHLEGEGFTIQSIVDAEVVQFENKTKRTLDVTDKRMPTEKITIRGLKEDQEKGFANHRVLMKRYDCPLSVPIIMVRLTVSDVTFLAYLRLDLQQLQIWWSSS
jgi:hypothetical protein